MATTMQGKFMNVCKWFTGSMLNHPYSILLSAPHCLRINQYVQKMKFSSNKYLAPMEIEKNQNSIQNSGSCFRASCKTALPIQPIYRKNGPNGLNWQCSLPGSSKTAPRILFFSIAMGAKPLLLLKFIAS